MEKSGGVYKVPCEVNGLRMKFIFDTGASHVCLSESMASFMYENGYLKSDDIVGKSQSRVADGRIVDDIRIVLHDIEIAGLHLKDVDAIVSSGQSAPLLLGQSAIQKLGAVTIDGNKLIINTMSDEDKDRIIKQLEESANDNYSNQRYKATINDILKIEQFTELTEEGVFRLCWCYRKDKDYHNCIKRCEEWLEKYEYNEEYKDDKADIYDCLGLSHYSLKNKEKSILYLQKELNENDITEEQKELICGFIAQQFYDIEDWYNASLYYKISINSHLKNNKVTKARIENGLYKNNSLGGMYFNQAVAFINQNRHEDADKSMILSAKCGYEGAITICKEYGLNYKTKTNPTPVKNKENRRR